MQLFQHNQQFIAMWYCTKSSLGPTNETEQMITSACRSHTGLFCGISFMLMVWMRETDKCCGQITSKIIAGCYWHVNGRTMEIILPRNCCSHFLCRLHPIQTESRDQETQNHNAEYNLHPVDKVAFQPSKIQHTYGRKADKTIEK